MHSSLQVVQHQRTMTNCRQLELPGLQLNVEIIEKQKMFVNFELPRLNLDVGIIEMCVTVLNFELQGLHLDVEIIEK